MKCRKCFRGATMKALAALAVAGVFAMTARANPWYEAPERVGLIDYSRYQNGAPSSSGISENGEYYATPVYMAGEQGYVFKTADLLGGDTAEKLVLEPNLFENADNRGADVSEALGMAIFGTSQPGGPVVAVRVDATTGTLAEGENYFRIDNDLGISIGCMEFSGDSAFLYTDCYQGGEGKNFIYKWQVLNGLAASGTNLVHVAHWDVARRIRQIAYANVGGKDLVYFSSDGGYLGVLDTTDGQVTTLRETGGNGNYGGIAVSGVSLGTPHLTVVPSESSEPIVVYALSDDGLALSGPGPVAALDSSVTSAWNPDGSGWHCGGGCSAVSVADDESTAYIGGLNANIGACTYVIQAAVPLSFSVTQSVGAHGTSSDPADAIVQAGESFTRAYTADEGYVIAAVYVDGVLDPEARFKPSYELTIAPAADTAVSVLFAKDDAWWVDAEGLGAPVVASAIDYSSGLNGAPFSSGLSENGKYYATPTYMAGEQGYVFKTADLLVGDTAEKLVLGPNLFENADNRGADVSEALGMAIFGTSKPGGPAVAVRVDATTGTLAEGENYFRIENDQGISFGCMEFSDDSAFLYTDCYKGGDGNTSIYKWQVENGLRTNGVALVEVARWDVANRVRQIAYANIGGKDLVYYISNGGLIGVLDTTTGTHEVLRQENGSGNYGAIAVSGVKSGTPHLTVVPSVNTFPIAVYGLAADGLSLVGEEPMIAFDQTVTSAWTPTGEPWHRDGDGWCTAVNVADDGSAAYIGGFPANAGATTYVVKSRHGPSTVTQTIGPHGAAADPGEQVLEQFAHYRNTYTADEGYLIAAVYVDGVPVPGARFQPAYDLDVMPESDTVIAATFVKKSAWWTDPYPRNDFLITDNAYNPGAVVATEDGEKVFFGISKTGFYDTSSGLLQFDNAVLADSIDPLLQPENGSKRLFASDHETFRCVMPSAALGVVFQGSIYGAEDDPTRDKTIAWPIGGEWGDSAYGATRDDRRALTSDIPMKWQRICPGAVSTDGKYLYGNNYYNEYVYQLEIQKDDAGTVTNLAYTGISWKLASRAYSMVAADFGDGDLIYVRDNSFSLVLLDPGAAMASGPGEYAPTMVCPSFTYMPNMCLTGKTDGTPRLIGGSGKTIAVWDLAQDGRSLLGSEPALTMTVPEPFGSMAIGGFLATLDDSRAYVHYKVNGANIHRACTFEKRPEQLIVERAFDKDAEGVDQVERGFFPFGGSTNVTIAAPAGYTIKSVSLNRVKAADNLEAAEYVLPLSSMLRHARVDVEIAPRPFVEISESVRAEGGDEQVRTVEVSIGGAFTARYDAPEWMRIKWLKHDGTSVPAAENQRSYEFTIAEVAGNATVEVVYAVPEDGLNGYTAAQARWFSRNGVAEDGTASDGDGDGLAAETECLLDLSAGAQDSFDFKVSSIAAGARVEVTVSLARDSGGTAVTRPVLGTLFLEGASAVDGDFRPVGSQSVEGAFDGKEVETFDFEPTDARFFRAVIR